MRSTVPLAFWMRRAWILYQSSSAPPIATFFSKRCQPILSRRRREKRINNVVIHGLLRVPGWKLYQGSVRWVPNVLIQRKIYLELTFSLLSTFELPLSVHLHSMLCLRASHLLRLTLKLVTCSYLAAFSRMGPLVHEYWWAGWQVHQDLWHFLAIWSYGMSHCERYLALCMLSEYVCLGVFRCFFNCEMSWRWFRSVSARDGTEH